MYSSRAKQLIAGLTELGWNDPQPYRSTGGTCELRHCQYKEPRFVRENGLLLQGVKDDASAASISHTSLTYRLILAAGAQRLARTPHEETYSPFALRGESESN